MTTGVRQLLQEFDQLTASEQSDAVREILRRTIAAPVPPLSDDALVEIGEESFLELDRRETE